jgi:hypothetical protein
MQRPDLMEKLSALGVPMFEPTQNMDVNEVLADVVQSHDLRLWEAFPALLANGAEKHGFAPERVEAFLPEGEQGHLHRLLALSSAMYAYSHVKFPWSGRLTVYLSADDKVRAAEWKKCLAKNRPVTWDAVELDPERLKNSFSLYFKRVAEEARRVERKNKEFALSFALSQVFSPKQMELFKKKCEGLPLTKTEQEYYSRVVKKKVAALANSELHNMARRLLEQ